MGVDCKAHPMRPGRLYDMIDSVKAVINDPDPASKSVYLNPLHFSPFWATPISGFIAAKDEVGFSGEMHAACNVGDVTCVQDQIDYVQALTDGNPANGEADALGVGCKDASAMQSPLSAVAARIPVITFDSDVATGPATGRQLYLGAVNIAAGRTAGETILELSGPGEIHLYGKTAATANIAERAAGVIAVCLGTTFANAAEFTNSSACSNLATASTCEATCVGAHAGKHVVANFYDGLFAADTAWKTAHPSGTPENYLADHLVEVFAASTGRPVGFVSLMGAPGPIVEKAIADNAAGGDIKFVAWDFSTEIQNGLRTGTVSAALVQNAYFYGYLSAHIIYAMASSGAPAVLEALAPYFEVGPSDRILDTGMTVVTPENLGLYSEYQTVCLGLTSG